MTEPTRQQVDEALAKHDAWRRMTEKRYPTAYTDDQGSLSVYAIIAEAARAWVNQSDSGYSAHGALTSGNARNIPARAWVNQEITDEMVERAAEVMVIADGSVLPSAGNPWWNAREADRNEARRIARAALEAATRGDTDA